MRNLCLHRYDLGNLMMTTFYVSFYYLLSNDRLKWLSDFILIEIPFGLKFTNLLLVVI